MLFLLFSFLLKIRKIYKIIQIIQNKEIIQNTKYEILKYKIIQNIQKSI